MATVVDIGTLIERTPEIRRGRLCIADTGVTVRRIAEWHNLGLTPEEVAAKIEHLTLAQIHAALAYYHSNREEIDDDIAGEEAAVEELLRTLPPRASAASRCTSMKTRWMRTLFGDWLHTALAPRSCDSRAGTPLLNK